jgi:sugar lactone lactonase YvrE
VQLQAGIPRKINEDLLMMFARAARRCFASNQFVSALFLAIMILLGSGLSWASFSLTFQGLVRTLNTGGSISLSSPAGIVLDTAGNVYVVDTGNNRIVEVTAQGVASVLTISGLSPSLSSPSGIAIDSSGNLYIADTGNSRVVEVSASGAGSAISTGSVTLSSPRAVALDQSGDIFIADTGNNRIVEVTSGGSAAALTITVSSGTSTLSSPKGLAVNISGTLYIADAGNNRIVRVASGSTTGVVQSILGGVTLSNPSAVIVDRIGNIIIADTGNDRIAEVDTSSNGTVLYTDSVTLNGPLAMALDVFNNVYIADTGNSRGVIANPPVNGDLVAGDETYSLNQSAVGFGHITLGSANAVTLTLPFTTGATGGLGGVTVSTFGTQSLDFTMGPDTTCTSETGASTSCNVEISFLPTAPGLRNGAVTLLDTSLNPILTIALYGYGDSPVAALAPNVGSVISTGSLATSNPYQVALDGSGNLYVADYTGKNVTKIPAGGGSGTVINLGTPGGIAIQNLTGMAVDGAGNLYIGDHQNSRILVVTPGGVVSVLSITGLSPALGFPTALSFDAAGHLYIADFTNGRIIEISTLVVAGSTSSGLGTVFPTGSYSFTGSTLTGLTIDQQGNIYLAARTQNNSSIIKISISGVASAVSIPENITPPVSNPQGVGVDAMGNLYIVDTANSRIVEITSAGVASALSLSGLTNPNTLGSLMFGVTVDPYGNLYIPDWTNNRIVFVNISGAALSAFASTAVGSTSSDSPKTATVTNLGNQALVFSANPGYTTNFSQPSGSTDQCLNSDSLTSGAACNVSVQFTPRSVGSLSAGIAVTDNSLNVTGSTQQISVSGTAFSSGDTTAVAVSTNPTSATIGQSITVTAVVADTATGHTSTVPTGAVSFTDTLGSTVVSLNSGNAMTLASGAAVLTGVTLGGAGLHTITANYAGVSGSFLASSNTTTIQMSAGQILPAISWTPSATTILAGATLSGILNATASNAGSTVAGTFTYSATIKGGSAAAVTSTTVLAPGQYTLTATFTPTDTTAYSSATGSATLTVQDFVLSIPIGGTSSATVAAGGTATYPLTFAPSTGSTFPSAVTLTVSGNPPGSTATIAPHTIPAGSGSTNVTVTVQLAQQSASLLHNHSFALHSLALQVSTLMLGVLILPFNGALRRAANRHGRKLRVLLLVVAVAAVAGLSACSTQSGFFGNPQKSYVITVTATSGTISHSETLNLTVQ